MISKESGKDRGNQGRMAWGIYEIRGNRILVLGIYGPANGGEDNKNAQFYEEEVFEVLDTETYDKIIIVGDWNVFMDPDRDQKTHKNPEKYRAKTRECIRGQL